MDTCTLKYKKECTDYLKQAFLNKNSWKSDELNLDTSKAKSSMAYGHMQQDQ